MLPKANQNDQPSNYKEPPSKSGHLKKEDHLLIVNWLSNPKNFEDVFGCSKTGKVGRPPKSKVNGYHLMAIYLKSMTKSRINLTAKQMTERFKNYRLKYRKAHTLASSHDFGLNEEDHAQGFKTVAEKLDSLCPYYERMDELFGNDANITRLNQADDQESPSEEEESHDREEVVPNSPTEPESSTPLNRHSQCSPGLIPPTVDSIQSSVSFGYSFYLLAAALTSHVNYDCEKLKPHQERDNKSSDSEAPLPAKKKRKTNPAKNDLNLSEMALNHDFDLEEIHTIPVIPKSPKGKIKATHAYDLNQNSYAKRFSETNRSPARREGFVDTSDSQKTLIAREELEFKKYQFNMTQKNEENGIKLEEKKLSHAILIEEKKFELEREEKQKEREFQREKFELESARHQQEFEREQIRRKQEFSLECIRSGKSTEEIKILISMLFP